MLIKKSSIRDPNKYLGFITKGTKILIGVQNINKYTRTLKKIGFPSEFVIGQSILPSSEIGPKSEFNANGKYITHKDQEKENRYVRTVWWEWEQWSGYGETEHHEDWKDIYKDCYPKTFTQPPEINLSIIKSNNGGLIVASPIITWEDSNIELIKHIINLFLEIFEEAEVFSTHLESLYPSKIIKLNWDILPTGEMPWEYLRKKITSVVDNKQTEKKSFYMERLETISKKNPDFTAIGRAGFGGYVIFGFKALGIFLVESGYYGNATYIFGNEWETLSQMTKKEILDSNLQKDRIIHSKNWFDRVDSLFSKMLIPA